MYTKSLCEINSWIIIGFKYNKIFKVKIYIWKLIQYNYFHLYKGDKGKHQLIVSY